MSNDEELEEMEEETEESNETETKGSSDNSSNDFKNIVITECKRIIGNYVDLCRQNNDEAFIKALENTEKTEDSCVNHIMNNLVKKRVFGGADSLMYEYIHEYYVDNFTEVKDEWSKYLRAGGVPPTPGPKQQAKEDAKSKITEEQKQKYYEEALAEAKRAAELKAQEDFKKAEEKRKAKEKALAEKKKAEEEAKKEAERIAKEKAKEEAKAAGGAEQMSLFDFL